MINLNKKDSVADAVKSILHIEEGSTEFAAAKAPKHTDALTDKLIDKVEGPNPEETAARKSVKANGAAVEQPKVGLAHHKESVTLKGFKTRYEQNSIFEQMLDEVLSKDAKAGEWISDFVNSDNPKFAGKSKDKRKEMALAAYYAKQRNEEVEQIDELSKTTLNNYVDAAKQDNKDYADSRRSGDKEESRWAKDRMVKRNTGMGAAKQRLNKEEVESLDEGKLDRMSLTHLWHAHAKHTYGADQGWGGGVGGHHSDHAATAIENHVRKKHGNKVADDMVHHSELHVAHAEYVGGQEAKEVQHDAEKLRAKHKIKGDLYGHNESVNESVEQLDELSPELQHSYFKKAYDQKNDKTVPKATRQKRSKGMNKVINRTLRRNTISTPGASQDFKDQEARRGIGHVRDHVEHEEQVVEGWDDMVKAAKDSVKSGPKPSGGSGVKQGTRYGGGKQTSKPEQDEDDKKKVDEAKRPEDDSVPFAPPYSSKPAAVKDKSGAEHTPISRAKHLARLAMGRVKKDLGQKGK